MNKEFKVGLVVLIGVFLLFSAYVFFHAINLKGSSYEIKSTFKNLEKLDTGAVVRLSGFKIGNVTEIKLTDQSYVLVKMRIDKNIKIPVDSYCIATTGAVIGEMFIKITPGDSKEILKEGDSIKAVSKTTFDDLTKQLQTLLELTTSSMENVNAILGKKGYIITSMKNVEQITSDVRNMAKDMQITLNNINSITGDAAYITKNSRENLIYSVNNIKTITDNAVNISNNLEKFVDKDAIPQVKTLLDNANITMISLNATIANAKNILENLNENSVYFDDLIKDADMILIKAQGTIDNVDMLLKSFNEVSNTTNSAMKKVDSILGDKETIDNVKITIENIRDTSKEAKELIEAINKRLGIDKEKANNNTFSANISSENMYIDKDKKFRSDLYTDIFYGKNGIKLGINDIGEKNKGIFQYQRKFDNYNIGKIGLFNSKLGLGYEFKYKNFGASLDWYNPNRSELYLKGKYKFNPNFGIFMGIDDIIHKDNRNFLIGLSYER